MNKDDNVPMSQFNDWQLSLLILNMLWVRYDVSGISVGRSLRADLVETITDLTRVEHFPDHFIEICELTDVVKIRRKIVVEEQLHLDLGLTGLPSNIFYCFIVRQIMRWYEEDKKNEFALTYECKIVEALYSLMSCDERLKHFDERGVTYTHDQLLQEGRNRKWSRFLYSQSLYPYLVVSKSWIDEPLVIQEGTKT